MARALNRPLACAAAISLALHAALLALSAPASKTRQSSPPTLVARISEPQNKPEPQARRISKPEPKKSAPAVSETRSAELASIEAAPAPAAAASPTPTIADSTSVAQYRQQVIGVAVRYKVYPLQAVQNGWEGDVAMRVSIAASGAAQVSIKAGSGHELLDEQALQMFRLAAPQVPLPPALRGQEFGFEVRAVYALKD